jgi:RimJ/RimL family protein N-acetyltransferase
LNQPYVKQNMNTDIFQGEKVYLAAEEPEPLAEAFSRWMQDSEYFRFLDSDPPRLWSVRQEKEWMEKGLEKDEPDDFFFAIKSRADDRLLGFIALFDLSFSHGDSLVAIALGEREYWGQGYGTDAMRSLLRYAFQELNLRRISLLVFEYNTRAIRSYEKAGFLPEGRMRGMLLREGRRWDWLLMGILREEWQQKEQERT